MDWRDGSFAILSLSLAGWLTGVIAVLVLAGWLLQP